MDVRVESMGWRPISICNLVRQGDLVVEFERRGRKVDVESGVDVVFKPQIYADERRFDGSGWEFGFWEILLRLFKKNLTSFFVFLVPGFGG